MQPQPQPPSISQTANAGGNVTQVNGGYKEEKTIKFNLSLWLSLAVVVALGSSVLLPLGGETLLQRALDAAPTLQQD